MIQAGATSIQEKPSAQIMFGVLGAPAAWAAQGLLGWLFASAVCGPRPNEIGWLGESGLRALEIAIGVVALAVGVAALWNAIQAWRRSADPGLAAVHGRATPDFLAAVALFVSAAFTLGILWALLPALMLSPCRVVR
jgi:hypothetical protein